MDIKERINVDLKTAMLAGNKEEVTVLRGLKSAILYSEVSNGTREKGLSNDEVVAVFRKEAKKRQESADLYKRGNNTEKHEAELREKVIIEKYLPATMSEDDTRALVRSAVDEIGGDIKNMGQIIGLVKKNSNGNADGALVAHLVKEELSK